jgi:hypothetical protein
MKPINHAQAHTFIQAAADDLLTPAQQQSLQAHLQGCLECQAYAAEMQSLQSTLTHGLQDHWGEPQLDPQSVDRLVRGVKQGLRPPGDIPVKGAGRLITGLAGFGALAALMLLLGFAGLQFMRSRASAGQLSDKVSPITLAITDPHTGAQGTAGTSLLVHVSAGSPKPLLSLELWSNGQIVGVQAAPGPGGITPFAADFAWTPGAAGTYSLIARAVDADQKTGDSAPVVVIVGPTPKAEGGTADGDSGQSTPLANGSGGGGEGASIPLPRPPAPPAESDSIGPARAWRFSPVDWLTGISSGPPKAPELTARPAGCGAILSIHDLSDGEDGFIVFRMTESAPMLAKIATLDGQSQLDWLTYSDQSYSSANSYMVRAFKGTEVADSNIVFAQGNPADCPSDAARLPQLSIQLTNLKTDVAADMAYCYKSLNGADWSRWPTAGFFVPGPEGFDIQGQADSLVLNELDGKSLTLDLECWGWAGGGLKMLGKLHRDGIGPGLDHLQLTDGGLVAGLDVGGGIQTKDGNGPGKAPTDPKMPKIFAIIFKGPNACKEHLPGKGNNLLESLLYCTWFPEYNQDQGLSQPYLVWYVSDGLCVNGQGAVCNSFDSYVQKAKANGGQVGFHVYAQYNNAIPQATTPYDRTEFVVPPQNTCGQDVFYFTVRMFYQGGPNDPDYPNQMVEGPDSNTVTSVFNCPPPSEVKLDVTFDTLHIADLGDGAAGGDDLEIYASFVAEGKNPGSGSVLNLGYWGWSGSDCPDDSFTWLGLPNYISLNSAGISLECPLEVKNGDTSLAEQALCASNTYSHCVGSYSNNNNKIQITVGDGSRIRVAVHAMDYDENSGDDDVCHAETWIGPESIFGWQGFSTSGSMSQGDNGSASCTVFFHVAPSP